MGMNVGDSGGGPVADINVTPLVDVMLVLIIIFMVVAQALASGVNVELPKAATGDEGREMGQHINVAIRGDETLYVERKKSDMDKLIDDLNAEFERDPARSLLIKGDRTLKWGQVRKVMDKVNENGMSTMLLAVQKDKQED